MSHPGLTTTVIQPTSCSVGHVPAVYVVLPKANKETDERTKDQIGNRSHEAGDSRESGYDLLLTPMHRVVRRRIPVTQRFTQPRGYGHRCCHRNRLTVTTESIGAGARLYEVPILVKLQL